MRFLSALLGAVLLLTPAAGSFDHDVSRGYLRQKSIQAATQRHQAMMMNDSLLSKAMPLVEYQAKLALQGLYFETPLAEDRLLNEGDDFYLDDDAMYSFSGFSLKYTQCQPVKYFSEEVIEAGEHSPMVTQDIVLLRLCPQKSCSASTSYGCHYNYVEYAISLSDYLDVMLRFSYKKRDTLCGWCEACSNDRRRKLDGDEDENEQDEEGSDEEEENKDEEEDQDEAEENENDNADEEDSNEGQNDGDNAGQQYYYYGDCGDYDTYCTDYNYVCGEADDDNNAYVDYEEYMDYLQCQQVEYNGYAYFVRPRCNSGSIEMAVYYDDYCAKHADEVNVRDVGLSFQKGTFADFYSGECIDCSESVRWLCCCAINPFVNPAVSNRTLFL